MFKVLSILPLILLLITSCASPKKESLEDQLKMGDIVFQNLAYLDLEDIKKQEDSPFSHVGIVYKMRGSTYIYEASQLVRMTPYKDWLARNSNNDISVKRLEKADSIFTDFNLNQLRREIDLNMEKEYDTLRTWGDTKMYNSELVWKVFKNAYNIELASPRLLADGDKRVNVKDLFMSKELVNVDIK